MANSWANLGSSRKRLAFWRPLAKSALDLAPTPFYLFSVAPVQEALTELKTLDQAVSVPIRHWLSCKTQPVPALLRWWRNRGGGIEVVSEFELLAALRAGFKPERILVNGPAKHRWLRHHALEGLRVNFDSPTEIKALLPVARRLHWRLGIRIRTSEECDPENPDLPTQFGLEPHESVAALNALRLARVQIETVHFHLRTNVPEAAVYERALGEVAGICRAARFRPRYLDCGGGWPAHHVRTHKGHAYDAKFDLRELGRAYARALQHFDGVEELWLENGRFLTARSGVLVVRILDIKNKPAVRQLICDGGRTMNALISNWEAHEMFSIPERPGSSGLTTVCGPTCMAFDQLTRRRLPARLRVGDHLVWMDAGAYHLSWENHFSHGLAAVLWHENDRLSLVRRAETFEAWWTRWEQGKHPC